MQGNYQSDPDWKKWVEQCTITTFTLDAAHQTPNHSLLSSLLPKKLTLKKYDPSRQQCDESSWRHGPQHEEVVVYVVTPKTLSNTKSPPAALIMASGEQGLARTAQVHLPMAARYAVECNCTVFSVDCRAAPEFKCPQPQQDFYNAIKVISKNAKQLSIDPDKICTLGISGGAWITLGASYIQSKGDEKDREACRVRASFLIAPDISCSIDDDEDAGGILNNNFE